MRQTATDLRPRTGAPRARSASTARRPQVRLEEQVEGTSRSSKDDRRRQRRHDSSAPRTAGAYNVSCDVDDATEPIRGTPVAWTDRNLPGLV